MKPYLKRAKGSWQQGKGCKDDSARAERRYSKREIQEQLNHDEEAYLERYHKGARTRNMKARFEYRVKWYEERIRFWDSRGTSDRMRSVFRSYLEKARKDLEKYLANKKGQS